VISNQGALIMKIIQGRYERVDSKAYSEDMCSMVDK
jgi:hypothetical protein